MKRIHILAAFLFGLSVFALVGWQSGPWQQRIYRSFAIIESDVDTSAVAGDVGVRVPIPADMNGCRLVDVIGTVSTKGVTGTTDITPVRERAGSVVSMLSTDVTIGDEYYARDGVINQTYAELATGDGIGLTVTQIHSGTAPKGLGCTLTFDCPR